MRASVSCLSLHGSTTRHKMDALNPRAIKSLAFATVQSVAAVGLTYLLVNGRKKVSFVDKLAILWLVYDAIVHFTLVSGPEAVYLRVGMGARCMS